MLRLIKGRTGTPEPAPAQAPADELALLARRSRAGDAEATRTLLVTVGPAMLQVVRRVLGAGHPDAEDVFQEAALGLTDALPDFRGECTVIHFACRVAVLTALAARRRETARRRHDGEAPPDSADRLPADDPGPPEEALAARRRQLLRQLLDELPEAQAEALLLHCVAGFTMEEVARAARVGLETARSRLRLAKTALRARIAGDQRALELLEVES
jgi:RNA polymerase sigma-70 factor (ECF subfamily)